MSGNGLPILPFIRISIVAFLDPKDITKQANIKEGMIVADFGSGSGFRTIPIAHAVGRSGRVYALDIQKEMLEVVRGKAKADHLLNVYTIWADLESPNGSTLKDDYTDHVVVANILFQADDKDAVAKEAFRILKSKGTASVVEWDISAGVLGPPKEQLIDKAKTKEVFTAAGFIWDKEFYTGEHHYGLLFKKS
ncbi:MAG: hypothetical protein COU47_02275 [Candidatus Niyogibacteria bacterium CG10_big_fil_rev_8_21_14_0_10_46_36]|uniref:Methyltransferase domain-containing protein n=1 Tax=Candidatus Niyogibacteria bacterium CG10_big_fil_rev_8_21_14_0_10_46_36 TaxID=1974726 RepID=A0A2H0TDB7_9BACT|nr:MAG: hypothetical protein COU47_02275 [Candidatus Niyogibacteria bacterium CG10_big_fil_rev_8_21_14_0_10_46_36]